MNHWVALAIAIVAEVIGTTALKASNEFTRLWPSLIVVVGYGTAFYFMALSMRVLPVGIMYAIWSGMGIVLVSIIGWVVYRQVLDVPAMIGMGLIIAGAKPEAIQSVIIIKTGLLRVARNDGMWNRRASAFIGG